MPKNPNYCTIVLISCASKILQARLQQYMNRELPVVQAGFRKGRGTGDQIANTHWMDHNKLENFSRDENTKPPYLSSEETVCRSRSNSYATRRGKTDWFKIGKGARQGWILSPCLFNFYAEYIMWNARLDEAQAKIRIARRNINNLRYVDDTTLVTESKEELKSLLMKVKKESEKAGLKLNIQKSKIMASGPITLWQIDGRNGNSERLLFSWVPKSL